MPNWDSYFSYGTNTCSSYASTSAAAQMYVEWQQECKRQDQIYEQQMQMMEQQMREAEEQCFQEMKREQELVEDKEKYPLFFWKENI